MLKSYLARQFLARLCCIVSFISHIAFATPPPSTNEEAAQQAYKHVLSILQRNPQAGMENDFFLLNNLRGICIDSSAAPQDAAVVLKTLIDDPRNHWEIRQMAVQQLRCFHNDTVMNWLETYLRDSAVVIQAATVLLRWGDWDIAAPVLIAREAYEPLAQFGGSRTESFIREGALHGSPMGRLYAACALAQYFNDHSLLSPTAREIIQAYSAAQPGEDTLNSARLIDGAYTVLQENTSAADLDLFMAGVGSRFNIVRGNAFRGLMTLAREGNNAATQEIRRLRDYSPFQDVRERAAMGMNILNTPEQH
jgi:hypothetical protein